MDEIRKAEAALTAGLDGQARVLARRAAGEAMKEYQRRKTGFIPAGSAYDLIQTFSGDESLPAGARQVLILLQVRTAPSGEGPSAQEIVAKVQSLPEVLGLADTEGRLAG